MNSEIYEDDNGIPGGIMLVEEMLPELTAIVAEGGQFPPHLRLALALLIGSDRMFMIEHLIQAVCAEEGLL